MGKYTDTITHVFAALVLLGLAQALGGVGLGLCIGLLFLVRELAQADPHNMIAAIKTMPRWSWHKQAEWLLPMVVVKAVAV